MNLIELAYLLASTASVIAMWPQVRQLLVAKRSDELSLPTWITWTACQLISLVYSISIKALPFILANIAWVTFYITMLGLIFRYQRKNSPKTIPEPAPIESEV